MSRSTPLLTLALALLLAGPAAAQETPSPENPPVAPPVDDGTAFSTGEQEPGEIPDGGLYVVDVKGDWEIRCVKTPDGFDPCQIYQLLNDQNGNPTAEVTIVNLADAGDAVAGATILTPLETLLTQLVTVQIDGGQVKRYPFTWCDQYGCYSRIGFTGDELAQMKRGKVAKVIIVPAQAPTQKVEMNMSLTGITAAFDTMTARNVETARAAEAAGAGQAPVEGAPAEEAPAGDAPAAETPAEDAPAAGGN